MSIWIALLALVLVAAGACGVAFVLERRARQRRVKRPARLRYPVVLAHGVLGFDSITIAGHTRDYFNGMSEPLRQAGAAVLAVKVPPASSVAQRARALAESIRALPHERVNIIAHSMGGLDARYAIAQLGLHDRVASLTTIGTPHEGTPLADIGTSILGERLMLKKLAQALGLDVEAFWEMTTKRTRERNASEMKDVVGVCYASVVGACGGGGGGALASIHPMLLVTHKYLSLAVGDNDGLVPASSQAWGDVLHRVEADHWAQIGWSALGGSKFDAPALYVDIVKELTKRGF